MEANLALETAAPKPEILDVRLTGLFTIAFGVRHQIALTRDGTLSIVALVMDRIFTDRFAA